MFQNIEVLSPRKVVKVCDDLNDERDTDRETKVEEETDEYVITSLTENRKNMPKLIIRMPTNLNKLLTEEQEKLQVVDEIKCDDITEQIHSSTVFKVGKNNQTTQLTEMQNKDINNNQQEYKLETVEEEEEEEEYDSNDDEEEYDDDDDDDENKESGEKTERMLLKSFKSKCIEKFQTNVYNEHMKFLRDHTKDELSHFLHKKYINSSNEMKINDIINIDYDQLNEKNIIPYFLTNMFDIEQRKKRERIKKEMIEKRKAAVAEKQKRKSAIERKRKSTQKGAKGSKKGTAGKGGKGAKGEGGDTTVATSTLKRGNTFRDEDEETGKRKKTKNKKEVNGEEQDEEEEGEDDEEETEDGGGEEEEEDEEETEDGETTGIKKSQSKKKGKKKKDNDIDEDDDEFNTEENEINIYNDPNIYGIEGSSDYSEGFKSDEDNTQEEEEEAEENVRENSTNTLSSSLATGANQMETTKKKKKRKGKGKGKGLNADFSANDETLEDIIDASTEKLISYDYYSSLNINEYVKPSYKIKYLSSFIPIEDNIDSYDEIQKLQYLIKHLPHTHIKEKRSLYFYNIKQFIKWKTYLLNNINICLYGIGSKFHILNLFSKVCLNDGNKCTILGFEQEVNFDEILHRILEVHYKFKAPKSLKSYDLLTKLVNLVKENNIPLYFIIHNLDNVKLYSYYEYFSFLSQHSNIYFICSIDDVSFELNMNFKNISSINFFYMKCHTWIDYRYEIIKHWNRFPPEWVYNKRNEEEGVQKNFETILNALNINHKRLFKIIASMQLENLEKGIFGVEKESLLQDKRMFTVGASNLRINSLLVEFVSHNVITETRLKEGNTFLKINADKEELKRLIENL